MDEIVHQITSFLSADALLRGNQPVLIIDNERAVSPSHKFFFFFAASAAM